MSMQGLLNLHGVHAPRIVSATGGLSIGGATAGLQVKPHTFHGGDEIIESEATHWWADQAKVGRDAAEMAKWFPSFVAVELDEPGPPTWVGDIETGRGTRRIAIVNRLDHGLPRVVPLGKTASRPKQGRMLPIPHTYTNGNLCVAAESDWDPTQDTTATVVAWTAHWYACYFDWLLLGSWPSEGFAEAA